MSDQKGNYRILIAGINYGCILTMVRDLGRAGYPVDVLRVFRKKRNPMNIIGNMAPESKSKYLNKYFCLDMEEDPAKLTEKLISIADPSAKTLLISVDDYIVSAIDDNYDILSEYYVIPNIEERKGGITSAMDKDFQKRLAEEVGITMPKGGLIRISDGNVSLDEVPFPCFIKPNVSSGGSKLTMRKLATREKAEKYLSSVGIDKAAEILAEEYIDIKDEYSLIGFIIGDQVILPAAFRATLPGHRERKGVAVMGELTDPGFLGEDLEKYKELVRRTGFTGMFDIDLIMGMNGRVYFTEMNFRAGASVHAFTDMGVNIPAIFADCMLRGADPESYSYAYSGTGTFVSEKALLEEYVRNDISSKTLKKSMKDAEIFFVKDDEDPEPFGYFGKYIRIASVLRIAYGVRDKARGR